MKKLMKGCGLILIVLMLMSNIVLADPLSDQLKSQQNKLKQDKAELADVQSQLDDLEQNAEILDDQIGSLSNEIESNKKMIESTKQEIQASEKAVNDSENELQNSTDLLDKRTKAMYINGSEGYLELLFNAKSIGDFLSRSEYIARVISYDKKVIEDIKTKKEKVNRDKENLKAKENKLILLNDINQNKLFQLSSDKENQEKLAEKSKKQEIVLALNVSESQAQVNATLQQISAIRKAAPKVNLSRGAANFSTDSVIAYASNFLGTPYVWGGTKPVPGFDCSGFTQYVYAHFGVQLGRTTYEQINDGVQVSRDQLQVGDLVFFGTWSNPHHMGIYIGNNTYIHAPHTGDVIKVSSMTRGDYVTARRVR